MRYSHYMDSPGRVPDWRWKRAVNIQDGDDSPVTRQRDGTQGNRWIKEAMHYRTSFLACNTMGEYRLLQESQPHMYNAHQMYSDPKDMGRYSLEANLLTERSFLEIAYLERLPIETVTAFEAVFFNVRESLDAEYYILNTVICPSIEQGVVRREFDYVWKLYGYFYGGVMLSTVKSLTPDPHKVRTADTVNGAIRDDVIATASLQASIAAKTIGRSERSKTEMLTLFGKFVEIARDSDNVGKAQDSILSSIQVMMDHLPLEIGRTAFTERNPSLEYDKSAIELNVGEMTQLSTYGELPGKEEMLGITFESILEHNRTLTVRPQQ